MTTPTTINILVLCSTNETAQTSAKFLQQNINHIIAAHFTNVRTAQHKFFYAGMGEKITHDLSNNKCMSFTDTIIENCKYTAGQFDIIITNNCPSGYAKAIFTDNFFKTISYLLKNGGIFSYINFTNDSNTIYFKFNKKEKTYNYDEFNKQIRAYSLKHVEKYNIHSSQQNVVQMWHSIQKSIRGMSHNHSVFDNTTSRDTFYSFSSENNTAMAEPTKINILILCATDESAALSPTRLQSNIDYLIQNYFTKPNVKSKPIQQLYYMGDMLTHNLQNNKCKSLVNNMIIDCNYSEKMFDIILSEYCPSHTFMSVFSNIFFNNVKYLLTDNGIISWKQSTKNKKYTFKVTDNKQTSHVDYTHDDFYNMLGETYHLINDGLYNVINKTVTEPWCIIKKGSQINKLNKANVINTYKPIDNAIAAPVHTVTKLSAQDLQDTIRFINY